MVGTSITYTNQNDGDTWTLSYSMHFGKSCIGGIDRLHRWRWQTSCRGQCIHVLHWFLIGRLSNGQTDGNTGSRIRYYKVRNSKVVFADPDNGLCEDHNYRPSSADDWKRIPLSEALELSKESTGVIYHHNTRRKGGHAPEIQYWLSQLGERAVALYWRPYSPRTFFVVNPEDEICRRLLSFADRWAPHVQLHEHDPTIVPRDTKSAGPNRKLGTTNNTDANRCPKCGHVFKGKGWGGIDAHWKSLHTDIMEYSAAWSIIRKGLRPPDFV